MVSIITLTTDFGLRDGYVASMKGMILSINPKTCIVDITHNVEPQDIEEAAFILYTSYQYFPEGTIHVVVVDPEVGSNRRIIGLQNKEYIFLAPDNGILHFIYEEQESFHVFNLNRTEWFNREVSNTFHGRDIFAPIAAQLSRGVSLQEIGIEIHDFRRVDNLNLVRTTDGIEGHIIHSDRFGNLITNIRNKDLPKNLDSIEIHIGGYSFNGIKGYYAEVSEGELLALIGSSGFLEIAVRNGNAFERFHRVKKEKVLVKFDY